MHARTSSQSVLLSSKQNGLKKGMGIPVPMDLPVDVSVCRHYQR